MTRHPPAAARALRSVALGLVLVVGACSAAPPISPSSGLDDLVVPTPSPDPADFVEGIDNPWLPLERVEEARFLRDPGGSPGARTFLRPEAGPGPVIDGVPTTEVDTVTEDQETEDQETEVSRRTDYLAQDASGNVWWFGRAGVWTAGTDGAQPGLVMAAEPRVGDGYVPAAVPAGPDSLALVLTVEEVDVTREVLDVDYRDVVVVAITTPDQPGLVQRAYFARGVGLIEVDTTGGEPNARGAVPETSLLLESVVAA